MKVVIKNKIYDYLDAIKETQGIERQEVARRLQLTKQGLDNLAKSKNPTVKTLIKVGTVLGARWYDLIEFIIVEE